MSIFRCKRFCELRSALGTKTTCRSTHIAAFPPLSRPRGQLKGRRHPAARTATSRFRGLRQPNASRGAHLGGVELSRSIGRGSAAEDKQAQAALTRLRILSLRFSLIRPSAMASITIMARLMRSFILASPRMK